ncbi:histidine phosphatase family protein [Asticcacaulis sp. YBE204]|uniref:histidine phosphatase family protein n=1 Tax=Asticcacaulis sp. YBE204 TaxID=1282363 RepID=UPI0004CEDE38|nr:histidine phosphatase family protein [Asticcacaulis sp. YBE204]
MATGGSERKKVGAITLVRHGEPALSRRVKLDSDGYRDWWARYEKAGLLEGQMPPPMLLQFAREAGYIFSSTLQRSIETARAVTRGKPFVSLPVFVEAPLPPPKFPKFMKFSPKYWGGISRWWWWAFNHHQGEETRAQAEERARQAAMLLHEKALTGEDVLLLAHGYFNFTISLELKKLGYSQTCEQGFKYWGCRRYEKRV